MNPFHSLPLILIGIVLLGTASCQKATLIEETEAGTEKTGRGSEETQSSDSTIIVQPEITPEGWGAPIDVNFDFGGED